MDFSTAATEVPGDNFIRHCEAEVVPSQLSHIPSFSRVVSRVALDINIVNVKSVFWSRSFTMPLTFATTVSLKKISFPTISVGDIDGKNCFARDCVNTTWYGFVSDAV